MLGNICFAHFSFCFEKT